LKIPVSNVNGDPLFAFGFQTIGEQSQVDGFFAPSFTGIFDGIILILKDGFAIVQKAADKGTFSVINTSCR